MGAGEGQALLEQQQQTLGTVEIRELLQERGVGAGSPEARVFNGARVREQYDGNDTRSEI